MTTEQVWQSYAKDLKSFIISKVKNQTIADDILQDTFIRIHTKLHTLNDLNKLIKYHNRENKFLNIYNKQIKPVSYK